MERLNAPAAGLAQRLQYRRRIGNRPCDDFLHGHVAVVLPNRCFTLDDEALEIEHVSPWERPLSFLAGGCRQFTDFRSGCGISRIEAFDLQLRQRHLVRHGKRREHREEVETDIVLAQLQARMAGFAVPSSLPARRDTPGSRRAAWRRCNTWVTSAPAVASTPVCTNGSCAKSISIEPSIAGATISDFAARPS